MRRLVSLARVARLVLALAASGAASLSGATPLVGRVFDSMSAVVFARASVAIPALGIRAYTNGDGFFHVADVAPGVYTVELALPDGRQLNSRLLIAPRRAIAYIEFDAARIDPPDEDDAY